MVTIVRSLGAAAAFAFLFLLAQGAVQADEVKLFAGAGFKSTIDQIAPAFEMKTGHKIVATFDSEGGLTKRINSGEGFDVLVIGTSTVDQLTKEGKIVAATRKDIARAALALGVKKGAAKPDISSVAAFKQALLNTKSIAYIGTGHSGEYFVEMMQRLGIADQMKPKLKSLPPAQVTKATASGETEWTIWLAPGILSNPGVDLVGTLPAELQEYVRLTAGLNSAAKNAEGGKALIAFLTADAIPAMKARGWQPAPY
jgi:molybdate transport system substrate-binding protein